MAMQPALPAAACAPIGPSDKVAATALSPRACFAGRTIRDGTPRVILVRARPAHVVGDGRTEPDGALPPTRHVGSGNGKPSDRARRSRSFTGGRFVAALGETAGLVEADVAGNRPHRRFHAKGGLVIERRAYPRPAGRAAATRAAVSEVGPPVAVPRGTIGRVP